MTSLGQTAPLATPTAEAREFRADIQGVRAIAVTIVLAFHFGVAQCKGGFIGVDVFFVLSGYLITGLLVKELQKGQGLDYARFYGRRAKRLLPASALMTLFVCIAAAAVLSPLEQHDVNWAALATTLYLSNVYFAHVAQDYFAPQSALNPLLHTWSLAVEEQFYFVWPLLLAFAFKRTRSIRGLIWIISVISVVSVLVCVIFTTRNQPWAFFLMPMRAWEFGVGALTSLGLANRLFSPRGEQIVGWVGLGTLLATTLFLTDEVAFPGSVALLPALATVAILISGRQDDPKRVGALLSLPPFQFVGLLSYSLYLWHWPILVMARTLSPALTIRVRLLALLVTVVASYLTYNALENPIRSTPYLARRPRVIVASAAALSVVMAAGCMFWGRWIVHQEQYTVFRSVIEDVPELFAKGCDVRFADHQPKACVFGDVNSSTSVVLFGDSHAAEWFPALADIATSHKWKVVTYIKSSCPSADIEVFRRTKVFGSACDQWRSESIQLINHLQPTAVVMGNYTGYGTPGDESAVIPYKDWLSAYRSTLSKLDETKAKIFLLDDTPRLPFDSSRCLSRAAWKGTGSCPQVKRSSALNATASQAEQDAAREFHGPSVISLNDQICRDTYCPLSIDGQLIYRDLNHLTARFVRKLAPGFASQIVPIISDVRTPQDHPVQGGSMREREPNGSANSQRQVADPHRIAEITAESHKSSNVNPAARSQVVAPGV